LPPAPDWAEFISQKLAEVDSSPVILVSPQENKKPSLVAEAAYTSTHQVHARSIEAAPASNESELAMVQTQPLPPAKPVSAGCPQTSAATFEVIPIEGPVTDHPDVGHGDLNIALRGYQPVAAPLDLVFYEGQTDPDPPQLTGLFQPNRPVLLQQGYQVNHWLWDAGQCGGQANGCAGSAIGEWDITLVGLAATPGETINIPQRSTQIYGGGYKALSSTPPSNKSLLATLAVIRSLPVMWCI
jgi:hypothetical protein